MAQDYNIYIHASVEKKEKPTVPKEVQELKDFKKDASKVTKAINVVSSVAQNPDSLIGMAGGAVKAAASGSKAGVVGAVVALAVYAGLKIADKTYGTYLSFVEPATGNYVATKNYENFKNNFKIALNPVSTIINYNRERMFEKIQNVRNEQQMFLTGGTILNDANGRYL